MKYTSALSYFKKSVMLFYVSSFAIHAQSTRRICLTAVYRHISTSGIPTAGLLTRHPDANAFPRPQHSISKNIVSVATIVRA